LLALIDDPDWRVRHEVASRAEPGDLKPLINDSDPLVRELAASRCGAASAADPASRNATTETHR
jgi:hypothetical protein